MAAFDSTSIYSRYRISAERPTGGTDNFLRIYAEFAEARIRLLKFLAQTLEKFICGSVD
jgi:hypothetical protein